MTTTALAVVVVGTFLWRLSAGSTGDRSNIFTDCLRNCSTEQECSKLTVSSEYMLMSAWRYDQCVSECQYSCMWITVDVFREQLGVVPQFFGKWPFVRLLGIQEPASVLFSLANLYSFVQLLLTTRALPRSAPYRSVWTGYAWVGIVTWCASILFHTKDTSLTEKLDYFSAFGAILYGLFACLARTLLGPTPSRCSILTIALPCLAYFAYHVHFLAYIIFDYGYNMRANIFCGALTSVVWLVWVSWESFKFARWKELWPCAATVLLGDLFLLLEVFDFPPIFWSLDAHALWHLSTAPLPLLWAKFVANDCLYMRKMKLL
uniref:Post-GPI attachment to proteins factor 3 n=1 Tax=Plectus sambesii TaxID=2011161 RepID=A0A914W024_9BILA